MLLFFYKSIVLEFKKTFIHKLGQLFFFIIDSIILRKVLPSCKTIEGQLLLLTHQVKSIWRFEEVNAFSKLSSLFQRNYLLCEKICPIFVNIVVFRNIHTLRIILRRKSLREWEKEKLKFPKHKPIFSLFYSII